MSELPVDVHVQVAGEDIPAGRIWAHRGRGAESMTFAYRDGYLADGRAYALDPVQLDLHAGQQQTPQGRAIFGAFSDAAPDTWGRRLIDRRETRRARDEQRARRSFGEIDYLLGVRDDLRQGALRFRPEGSETFVATERTGVPTLTTLGAVLAAAESVERGRESAEDLRLLTRAGSSLGGARPKAHVRTAGGRLAIAKFPSARDDDRDVMRWEFVAWRLARAAGLTVPPAELHRVDGRSVLVVDRFDRAGDRRIAYVSAMTMLGLRDGDRASYLEIADSIATHSPHAERDLRELWRRVAFSILISNSDDHLRNHGFLRTSTAGWALSPAFDINPDPDGGGELSTAVDFDDHTASIDLLLGVGEHFRLDRARAIAVLREVAAATAGWRAVATEVGLETEVERLAPAFEHSEAERARAL